LKAAAKSVTDRYTFPRNAHRPLSMFILPRATRPGPSAKEHLCRLGAGGKVVFGTEVDVGVMGVAVAALALLAKFASLGATSTAACAYRGVSRPPPPADPGGVGASAGVCW